MKQIYEFADLDVGLKSKVFDDSENKEYVVKYFDIEEDGAENDLIISTKIPYSVENALTIATRKALGFALSIELNLVADKAFLTI